MAKKKNKTKSKSQKRKLALKKTKTPKVNKKESTKKIKVTKKTKKPKKPTKLKKIKVKEVKKMAILEKRAEKAAAKEAKKAEKAKNPSRFKKWKQKHRFLCGFVRFSYKSFAYMTTTFLILGIVGALVIYTLFAKDLPDVKVLSDFNVAETTYIYDREGNELYRMFQDENRKYVPLEQISDIAVKATLAIEDKQFYEHIGFDVSSIIRAALKNREEGEVAQGASTITMQLVKNMFLSNERTYERKIKELILSFQVERNFTKNEILELYMNKIPYGSNAYGIETASQTFFGKSANELDLLESIILASLPKAPTHYSPYSAHKDELMGYCKLDRPNEIDSPIVDETIDGLKLILEGSTRTWMKIVKDRGEGEEFFLNEGEVVEFYANNEIQLFSGNKNYVAYINGHRLKDVNSLENTVITKENYQEFVEGDKSITDETQNTPPDETHEAPDSEGTKCTGLYDPNYNMGRKDHVLLRMIEDGYINESQAQEAWKAGINYKFSKSKINIYEPHFVFYVKELLENKYGKELVNQGGLHIVTTLDPNQQELAKQAIADNIYNVYNYNGNNQALISANPKTGEIYAMVGSADFYDEEIDGQVNIVTSERQPGSSFKPFVYGAAIQNGGWGSGTVISDYKTVFNGDYIPNNSDGAFKGSMTMRTALALSRNIPAVKAYFLAGEEEPLLDYIDKFGIKSLREFKNEFNEGNKHGWQFNFGPPMAIGTGNIKLMDLVGAYGVYANMGERVPLNPILEIRDRHGNILEKLDPEKVEGSRAVDPQVAYIINSILSDANVRPAGSWRNRLTVSGHNVAAKTGTSNKKVGDVAYPSDGLTIGYTPSIVVGVWSGNTDGMHMKQNAYGLNVSAPTLHQFLENVLANYEKETWERPDGIIERNGELYPSWESEVQHKTVDQSFTRIKSEEELEEEEKEKEEAEKEEGEEGEDGENDENTPSNLIKPEDGEDIPPTDDPAETPSDDPVDTPTETPPVEEAPPPAAPEPTPESPAAPPPPVESAPVESAPPPSENVVPPAE